MTSQHSPEPWKIVGGIPTLGSQDTLTMMSDINGYTISFVSDTDIESISEVNAARIIACVNACAGIPIDELHMIKIWRASHHQNLYREGV